PRQVGLAGDDLHVRLHAGEPPVPGQEPHGAPGPGHQQQAEQEDPLHARTSSAPARWRISSTARTWSAGQRTSTPNRSAEKRGSYRPALPRLGSRLVSRRPSSVHRPPKRIVSSKAMTTKGGMETTGFPPTMSPHLRDDQMVSQKPVAVPVRPPTSVNRRTGLRGSPWPVSAS